MTRAAARSTRRRSSRALLTFSARFRAVPGFPNRLWLHAERIELPDGRSFTAPLPPELAAHLAELEGLSEARA